MVVHNLTFGDDRPMVVHRFKLFCFVLVVTSGRHFMYEFNLQKMNKVVLILTHVIKKSTFGVISPLSQVNFSKTNSVPARSQKL